MSKPGDGRSRQFDPLRLEPGQMLGPRYRILELLGTGGMGAVYRARDTELEVDVALKLLKPELLGDEKALERLKTELLLARQVSHRNVVRIHDLGTDETGELKYISMAYIKGETLRRILEREKKLPLERSIPIILELCEGLAAAHEVGVVHRDFKPENIIIDTSGHAFITDFGIARSLEMSTLTRTGAAVGTLQYMSPEQARGEKVDQRADIYSLGLVAYEMLTGHMPHESEATPEFVARILGQRPLDPRRHEPEIPAYLAKIILRCLEPEPALRYASAREVARSIEAKRAEAVPWLSAAGARRLLKGRSAIYALALSLVLALGILIALEAVRNIDDKGRPGAGSEQTAPSRRASIIVLPFLNRSSDPQLDWLRTALADLLISELLPSKQLRVPRADEVFQLMRDLKVEGEALRSEATLREVARFLNGDLIVDGSFARAGSKLAFELKLYKARAGSLVHIGSLRETGAVENVFAIAAGLATEIKKSVDPSLKAELPVKDGMTRSTDALKSYSLGLEKLRQGDYGKAVALFEEAIKNDAGFVMAYAKLSDAYYQWGYQDEARRAYERALSALDPKRSRLLDSYQIRAQYALLSNDLDAAIGLYSEAAAAYPHNAEIYLALGHAYERKGELERAAASYEKAAELEPNNFRVSLALGRLYIMINKYGNAIEQLTRALSTSTQLDNNQGRADALNAMGIVHQRMRRFDEAERAYLESIAIKRGIGDRRGIAASLQNIANLYSLQEKFREAEAKALEALEIFEELKNQQGMADVFFNLGHIYQDTGRFHNALESFRRALNIARELGNLAFLAELYARIGQIYYFLGQYADADTYQRQALAESQRIGDEEGMIRSLQSLGDIDLEQARCDSALERHRAALEQSRRIDHSEAAAVSVSQMGLIYQLTGRYRAALSSYQEAHNTFSQLKIKARLAEIEKRLASLQLEMGDAARAREHLGRALEAAAEIKDQALLSEIAMVEGELALAQGNTAAAEEAFKRARRAAEKSGYAKTMLSAEINMARLECQYGDRNQGIKLLGQHLGEAERMGQAEAIAKCYLYLLAAAPTQVSPDKIERWFDRLSRYQFKRYLAQFSLLAAEREGRAGRSKEAERFRREAARLLEELGVGMTAGKPLQSLPTVPPAKPRS